MWTTACITPLVCITRRYPQHGRTSLPLLTWRESRSTASPQMGSADSRPLLEPIPPLRWLGSAGTFRDVRPPPGDDTLRRFRLGDRERLLFAALNTRPTLDALAPLDRVELPSRETRRDGLAAVAAAATLHT